MQHTYMGASCCASAPTSRCALREGVKVAPGSNEKPGEMSGASVATMMGLRILEAKSVSADPRAPAFSSNICCNITDACAVNRANSGNTENTSVDASNPAAAPCAGMGLQQYATGNKFNEECHAATHVRTSQIRGSKLARFLCETAVCAGYHTGATHPTAKANLCSV
jgi:hypothetical protein